MTEALYRKYRPQLFRDVVGQDGVIKTLCNELASDRLAHAYIFAGTRGTGKTSTARLFAKALNCKNRAPGTFEPCDACDSCRDITLGRSVDVIELDAATHTGVDNVREHIIENARTLPTRDRFKIFIIDEVHMLSPSSFNALLKSIEEPPAHVVFLLATTELHKIPATVQSRCQRFVFRPLTVDVIEKKLQAIAAAENISVEPNVVHRIIAAAGGAMRDAESLLGQLMGLESQTINDDIANLVLPPTLFTESLALIRLMTANNAAGAYNFLDDLSAAGVDLSIFHDILLVRSHQLLIISHTATPPPSLGIFTDAETAALREVARTTSPLWLAALLEELIAKRALYRTIGVPSIPLHLVIAKVCGGELEIKTKLNSTATPKAPTQQTPKQQPAEPAVTTTPMEPVEKKINLQDRQADEIASPQIRTTPGDITEHWNATISEIVKNSPSLGIIFSATVLQGLENDTINLSVNFPLYREKLLHPKLKHDIEAALAVRIGRTVRYDIIASPAAAPTEAAVADILDTFGGRVIA